MPTLGPRSTGSSAQARVTPSKYIVLLGAHAGLRVSEMTALTWDNIDLGSATLKVVAGRGVRPRESTSPRPWSKRLSTFHQKNARVTSTTLGYAKGNNAQLKQAVADW